MLKFRKWVAGFTFTEILVTLVINLLILAILVTLVLAFVNHYRRVINVNRLNQQLQSVMNVMVHDIRRAGYWGNAQNDMGTHANNNPFMATGVDVSVTGGNCILLAYDADNDGSLPAISSGIDDERYGYRLTNQAVQGRPPGAAWACNAAANLWENLTDTNLIQITALTFTLNTSTITTGPGTRGLSLRSVDITLTGRLASDTTVTRTLTEHIRIRNDKFIP